MKIKNVILDNKKRILCGKYCKISIPLKGFVMENKAKTIKFLHCADIHLDTPYVGLSPEKSDEPF